MAFVHLMCNLLIHNMIAGCGVIANVIYQKRIKGINIENSCISAVIIKFNINCMMSIYHNGVL